MNRLEGKVVIVTGASSGMGRAIALESFMEGAAVVCADIRKDPIPNRFAPDDTMDTDELICKSGGKAIYVYCDVSDSKQVEDMIRTTVETFGRLDAIFNNAGVMTGQGTILEKTDKQLNKAIDVNFKGVWYCCQKAIEQFLKQGGGGKIVNIGSIGGVSGIRLVPEYCATKAAVISLTRQLAVDYGEHGIHVNAICPGNVETSMITNSPEEELQYITSVTPMHRRAKPVEIAKAAVFFASDDSDFITGQYLLVDGGLSSRN